jgi:D-arabinan exo alpha-(1,3)/(1,5)-arabinofuranosidase (non-reducing end)
MTHPVLAHPRAGMFSSRSAHSKRVSSWDRSGANLDYVKIGPGETFVLMDQEGPGCVTHLYAAMVLPDLTDYRDAILRCFWDDAAMPAVEVPLGEFFGVIHGRVREYRSEMTAVNEGLGSSHGLNAYFPMPFNSRGLITLENRGVATLGGALGNLWYHIDYEVYESAIPADLLRFHASYRQERPTRAIGPEPNVTLHEAPNLDGAENYVALDTVGHGRMVGLVLGVENLQGQNWYGEGDDMVFIDGDVWPPSIHGTGSEEIFGGGACPRVEYAGPYTGFHLIESPDYAGLVGMYRWYVHDPIHFDRSLRWTIEHGHANNFANDYVSVAYWYQTPQAHLASLPDREQMLPPLGPGYEEARDALFDTTGRLREAVGDGAPLIDYLRAAGAGAPFYRGDWQATLTEVERFRREHGMS